MSWFRRQDTKRFGWFLVALVLGFGAGNYHATTQALAGQKQWLADRCGQTVKKKVEQHIQADRQMFGFAPEDLKR